MVQKKLIVNADDFGQSKGTNEGIIKAHEDGIVTSASLMVRYPAAEEAVEYGRHHPPLGIGLHLDLGEWFYADGEWKALYHVIDTEDAEAVKGEVHRQLEMFYKLTGQKPTHIDSHQHVHLREHILPIVKAVAQQLNVPLRRCSNKVKYCGDFYGQAEDGSAYHQAIGADALEKVIGNIAEGITELACHPGLKNDVETMYSAEREIEVKTLCDQRIRNKIQAENIELCSFVDIGF